MKYCPLCNYENEDHATHCSRCGVPISTDPAKDYIPAFAIKDKIRDLYKMVEEEASYRACYDMAFSNKLKMIASGGKDPDITIMSRILSFPGYAVKFVFHTAINYVIYTLLVLTGTILFNMVFGYGNYNNVPSDVTLLLIAVVTFIWAVLRSLNFVPTIRSLFRTPARRKQDAWDKKANEVEAINQERAMKLNINDAIRIRKDAMSRIPGFKPEYWNECDLRAMITCMSSAKMPKCWDDVFKVIEAKKQTAAAKDYRARALAYEYTHEKMGDPEDSSVYSYHNYMKIHAPEYEKYTRHNGL